MRRVRYGVVVVVILVLGALAYSLYEWTDGPDFSPAEWREARASDSEDLDLLATDAVESDALLDKSGPELRQMLGRPDRVDRERRVWGWYVGEVNDYFGPGDDVTLYIRFNPRTRRSSRATTGP